MHPDTGDTSEGTGNAGESTKTWKAVKDGRLPACRCLHPRLEAGCPPRLPLPSWLGGADSDPQAPACCSCSAALQPHHPVPCKSRNATPACWPRKAPLPWTASQHSTGEGPAASPPTFCPSAAGTRSRLWKQLKQMKMCHCISFSTANPTPARSPGQKELGNPQCKRCLKVVSPAPLAHSPRGRRAGFL